MNKPIVIGALAIAAFIASVVYLRHDSTDSSSAATTQSAAGKAAGSGAASSGVPGPGAQPGVAGFASGASGSNAAPPDPRLAVFAVSPDNGLIQFVRLPDGRVITEIDKDPSSPSVGRPLREYLYAGDKVIGLTAYRYLGDHTEINKTMVSYKPDGSVDRFAQSTSIDSSKK